MLGVPKTLFSLLPVALLAGLASAQTYTAVPGSFSATDITPNGRYVVGTSNSGGAYVWDRLTPGATPKPIGLNTAVAVSDDGSVIAGDMNHPMIGASVAGIWEGDPATGDGEVTPLGGLPGDPGCGSLSSAHDISGDGTTVVGLGWNACSGRGFKWTDADGMVELQNLGFGNNRASAIAADGSRIAGFAQGDFSRTPAIWSPDATGSVFDMAVNGELGGVSDDGTFVLGEWNGDAVYIDVTASSPTPVVLGSLDPGWIGSAVDMAENRSRIVGNDHLGLGSVAWVWGPCSGIEKLEDQVDTGMDVLSVCQAITPDGTVIVGSTTFQGGWIVELPPPVPVVRINEIRGDQPSTDDDEYFELLGKPGDSLDCVFYLVLGDGTGGSGVIEAVVDLTGNVIPASGYFVAAEGTFTLGTADLTTTLNFENNDNLTHLLVFDFTGSSGDDLDTDDDGLLDSEPWTVELDRVALIEEENPPAATEYHYGPPTVGPNGSFVPGHVFRRPEGAHTLISWNIGPFDPASGLDTPGAANAAPEISAATGGIQTLMVRTSPPFAGDYYLILASVSGTSPGIPLSSGVLPLNFDAATSYSLAHASGSVFRETFGILDGGGRAYAAVALPTLLGGSIGLTLNTAGVVIDPGTGADVLVTNFCGVTITP